MTKTYSKKENKFLWYFILALCIGLLIFGWLLVEYFAWQVMPLIVITIVKIAKLHKNPFTPVIELTDTGIQLLTPNNNFYAFTTISSIHLQDRAFNGYLKLKDSKKKIIIDSVAIPFEDQKEIAALINQKITQA